MHKTITHALLVSSIVLFPTLASAKGGIEIETHNSVGIDSSAASIRIENEARGGSGRNDRGRDHAEDDFLVASGTASSTHKGGYWSNPDNAEDVRGRDNETTHRSASSSLEHRRGENESEHRNRGGRLQSFLAFIFGQPGSTTVQDLKAQIEASSSIRIDDSRESRGLGFFARLFGFFKHD